MNKATGKRPTGSRLPITDEDRALGARVRQARIMAGMTLGSLAAKIGVSYQQLQKYEVGLNRISVTALDLIAQALGRPIAWFFGKSDDLALDYHDHALRELLATYHELPPTLRAHLLDHVKALRAVAAQHREIAA